MLIFWFWVLLLTLLLFFPVSQLIYVFSVRRIQRRLGTALDEDQLAAQKRRAWLISVVVSFAFSVLFNIARLGVPAYG